MENGEIIVWASLGGLAIGFCFHRMGPAFERSRFGPPLMLLGITCLILLPGGIGIPWGEINPITFWFVAIGTYVLLGLNFNPKGMFQLWHLQSIPFVPWMGAYCHVLVYFHSFLKSPIIIHYSQRIVGFIGYFFRVPSLRSWSCSCRTNNRSRFRIRPPYGKGKQSC